MSATILRRSILTASRRSIARQQPAAIRSFCASVRRTDKNSSQDANPAPGQTSKYMKPFEEIRTMEDLLPPGAEPGTVPTDLEQATGLERLEILGKMQGVDIFDMRPLDASRKGTLEDPIMVKSFGNEQYLGCTGSPADSHVVLWLTISRDRPVQRCPECGSAYKMEYVGPQDDGHGHDHGHGEHDSHHGDDGHHAYVKPKTLVDYLRPEYM